MTLKDLLIGCDGEIADPESKFVVKEDTEASEAAPGSVKITIQLAPSGIDGCEQSLLGDDSFNPEGRNHRSEQQCPGWSRSNGRQGGKQARSSMNAFEAHWGVADTEILEKTLIYQQAGQVTLVWNP